MLHIKLKQKNSKRPKRIYMRAWLKSGNDKSAGVSIFYEILLINKFQHYLRMNAKSYYWPYIDFYTLITYTSYNTYTYNYTTFIDYFFIYWYLQFTTIHVFQFYEELLPFYAIKTKETVSFEKVSHRTKFLAFVS